MDQTTLESLHQRLLNKAMEVRKAQREYYAFRPQNQADYEKKSRLLGYSKQKERELDAILKDEVQRQQITTQPNLF